MQKPSVLNDCFELAKPRVLSLIVVTHVIGFLLAVPFDQVSIWTLFLSCLGTTASCAGAAMLNSYLERDIDAKMPRTMNRALPAGRLQPSDVLEYGMACVLTGVAVLATYVNLLTGFLALLTAFLYVLVYTPLKQRTWFNTTIGAIPGALPILGGCTAATGEVGAMGWILFAILFIWQHPHFYAIAWMYKDEYGQAGFKMLSVVEPTGRDNFRHAVAYALLLIPVSIVPLFLGLASPAYAVIAVLLGYSMLSVAIKALKTRTRETARALLLSSVIYLPVVLSALVIDNRFIITLL